MSRCQDCHWLENALPVGRRDRTCSDLGERASNASCKAFQPKWLAKDSFALALKHKQISKMSDVGKRDVTSDATDAIAKAAKQSLKSIFQSIISESFVLEQDSELAILDIGRLLEQQGANVEMNASQFKAYKSKIVDLIILHKLIHALGMSLYLEEIMGYEIANKFSVAPKSSPARLSPLAVPED